jgi:hypothetical protein
VSFDLRKAQTSRIVPVSLSFDYVRADIDVSVVKFAAVKHMQQHNGLKLDLCFAGRYAGCVQSVMANNTEQPEPKPHIILLQRTLCLQLNALRATGLQHWIFVVIRLDNFMKTAQSGV